MSVMVGMMFAALIALEPVPLTAGDLNGRGTIGRPSGEHQILHRIKLSTSVGTGDGRLVVKAIPLPEEEKEKAGVTVTGTNGALLTIRADQREHAIPVPSSYPKATLIYVDSAPIVAVLRKGEKVYFLRNPDTGWTLVSSRTDARMSTAPTVVCKLASESCPEGYVMSSDPPLFRDKRCADPERASSKTAKLCYQLGKISFKSDERQTVEFVNKTPSGPRLLRKLEVGPGVATEPVPIDYEPRRPVAIRIRGAEYVFAVGHGEEWTVTIGRDGVPAAVVR